MQQTQKGAMLSTAASPGDLETKEHDLGQKSSVPMNAPHLSLTAALQNQLTREVGSLHLPVNRVPILSCAEGTWISDEQVVDPNYWARVRTPAICNLFELLASVGFNDKNVIVLESRMHSVRSVKGESLQTTRSAAPSLSASYCGVEPHIKNLVNVGTKQDLARLWESGIDINWRATYQHEVRRISLPTYPFERERFWVEPRSRSASMSKQAAGSVNDRQTPEREPNGRKPRPSLRNQFVPARTEAELAILEIVEAALGIHSIGVTDGFGDLGGDSLMAISVTANINSHFGCHLQVVDLFEAPTIRELSLRVAGH
jgi:acyl transferase domain-containing protein